MNSTNDKELPPKSTIKDTGFEAQEDEEKDAAQPAVIKFFVPADDLKGTSLRMAGTFQDIAKEIVQKVPDGTARSAILERLLESRDSIVRLFKGHP